jgi:hypothetical protein
MVGFKMTLSPDEAREALATVQDAEQRTNDYWLRTSLWWRLCFAGWGGLVGFGMQSKLAEFWFGGKVFSGYMGMLGFMSVAWALPLLALMRFEGGICLNTKFRRKIELTGLALGILASKLPLPLSAGGLFSVEFLVGTQCIYLGAPIAVLLWLGRTYAFAGLAIILCLAAIVMLVPTVEWRLVYLALLSGLVLLPAGIALLRKEGEHVG